MNVFAISLLVIILIGLDSSAARPAYGRGARDLGSNDPDLVTQYFEGGRFEQSLNHENLLVESDEPRDSSGPNRGQWSIKDLVRSVHEMFLGRSEKEKPEKPQVSNSAS
ncbi:hypothetical protein PGT21_002859 [Puccinia graminis f. sp. tritici]|uniref:Uncharacterized protein n=1 Tax=Puccinia graminis f. sp. tritici TaxID=56615 RepID=A0A5B0SD61_PUCGR|nr:hypothetical protein PGT21_002859 [Puccinia graminis f. sp. tritici]KAA1134334.1 hypothetical protein PGTUg99_035289 [Puccinia graminis f. sp. tritici]